MYHNFTSDVKPDINKKEKESLYIIHNSKNMIIIKYDYKNINTTGCDKIATWRYTCKGIVHK